MTTLRSDNVSLEEEGGGGGGSTWSILEYQNFVPQQLSGDLE